MTALAVTNTFANGTLTDADKVNTNFGDIVSWGNTYPILKDGSVDFDALPASFNAFPKGLIGFATGSTSLAQLCTGSSYADVTGCTATFTAVANRYYKITLQLSASHDTGAAAGIRILAGTSTVLQATKIDDGASSYEINQPITLVSPPTTFSAGSVTVKGQIRVAAGAGAVYALALEGGVPFIMIEDVGPSS